MCEGRPCVIDPADCNLKEPSVADFPETVDLLKAQTWVHWVRLSCIVGRVAKYRACKTEDTRFPGHLARELIDWVQSLPDGLWLPISGDRHRPGSGAAVADGNAVAGGIGGFNRDVHQLYLPYLSAITLLYLTKSSQPLAKGYTTAILSAACVARIFEDFLARRSVRFLQGLAGWHIEIAILALLHGRRIKQLTEECDRNIALLRIALKEIGKSWPSARMFDVGFERAVRSEMFAVPVTPLTPPPLQASVVVAQQQAHVQMQMAAQVSPTTVVPPAVPQQQQQVEEEKKKEEKKEEKVEREVESEVKEDSHDIAVDVVDEKKGDVDEKPVPDTAGSSSSATPEDATTSPEESGAGEQNSTPVTPKTKCEDEEMKDAPAPAPVPAATSATASTSDVPMADTTTVPAPTTAAESSEPASASVSASPKAATSAPTSSPLRASALAPPATTAPSSTSTFPPVPATQITLPPMALHPPPPHPRPPRPGCNSSLSELADVATGTMVNWLDFFPFATRETSPLVDVLLQNSRAGLLEFDGVDWPVSDMTRMLNDLLYY